ncbi:hypothetical protein FRB99_003292, partial [Tulasnella sp. 403]
MSQETISPHNQEVFVTRQYPSPQELDVAVERSAQAQTLWQQTSLDERIQIAERFM